jgi:hypothetical protein
VGQPIRVCYLPTVSSLQMLLWTIITVIIIIILIFIFILVFILILILGFSQKAPLWSLPSHWLGRLRCFR